MADPIISERLSLVLERLAAVAERWVAVAERREDRLAGQYAIKNPDTPDRKAERIAELEEFLTRNSSYDGR